MSWYEINLLIPGNSFLMILRITLSIRLPVFLGASLAIANRRNSIIPLPFNKRATGADHMADAYTISSYSPTKHIDGGARTMFDQWMLGKLECIARFSSTAR